MKIIERKNIDTIKWNELVNSANDASVFSFSWYLDAVAEDWCILVNSDYTCGIALPFMDKLGTKTLYTPVFIRYLEVLGDHNDVENINALILSNFKFVNFSTKQNIFGESSEKWMHQIIPSSHERKIGSQAKRSLKKAVKNGLEVRIHSDTSSVLDITHKELTGKFEGLNSISMRSLDRLMKNIEEEKRSVVFEIESVGGIVCIRDEHQLIYLKGAVTEETKKNGGMYLVLDAAINFAKENRLDFDFGGSRMEGVRKFNFNLGGIDSFYYNYQSNNYPFWYRFLKKVKEKIKK